MGRQFCKNLPGYGETYTGKIIEYRASSIYLIRYDNGDEEELAENIVYALLYPKLEKECIKKGEEERDQKSSRKPDVGVNDADSRSMRERFPCSRCDLNLDQMKLGKVQSNSVLLSLYLVLFSEELLGRFLIANKKRHIFSCILI